MSKGVFIRVVPPKQPGDRPVCYVELDATHAGRQATFSLVRKVAVHDRRAVDKEDVLFEHGFRVSPGKTETFELPGDDAAIYSYKGPHMDIQLLCRVVVDDGIVWDTTVDATFERPPFPKPRVGSCARHIEDPEDQYEFFKNLERLPPGKRMLAGSIAVLGIAGLAALDFVAIHDTVVPYDDAIVFSSSNGPPGLVIGLFGTIFGVAFLYLGVKRLLAGYVDLRPAPPMSPLGRDDSVRVGDLFQATALSDLSGLTVRVIACNREKGQYRRGSGTNTRTVSFSHPTRGVVLYERTLGFLRGGRDLTLELHEPLDLTPMFDALYPPQMAGPNHGMDVHFEVQLLHDDLVDRELVLPRETFDWHAFLDADDDTR